MWSNRLRSRRSNKLRPRPFRPHLEALEKRETPSTFAFDNGSVTNQMGVTSHPASSPGATDEHEAADDFVTTASTAITGVTFTGLLPSNVSTANITDVHLEIYQVFPNDSNVGRTSGVPVFSTSQVPTRVNSPSDVALQERDSVAGDLSFTTTVLNGSFTVNNSVINGINPKPNQTTGGEGPQTGQEVQFTVNLSNPFLLNPGHFFFVPQVQLSGSPTFPFLWLSSTRPNPNLSPDLQSWTRDSNLDPDWLRVGTDIVGGTPAPTFNQSFSLSGDQGATPSLTIPPGQGVNIGRVLFDLFLISQTLQSASSGGGLNLSLLGFLAQDLSHTLSGQP
jgi:hypothetical protein